MTELLPIIEELADAESDQARAYWLASCPIAILMTYQETIRNRLRSAGFLVGVAYLEAVLAAMRSVRRDYDRPLHRKLIEAQSRLFQWTNGGDRRGIEEASPTEL